MTRKKQARIIGKAIRKATGLKLPIAMRLGKFLSQGRSYDIPQEFCSIRIQCGDGCCQCRELIGPKGTYSY